MKNNQNAVAKVEVILSTLISRHFSLRLSDRGSHSSCEHYLSFFAPLCGRDFSVGHVSNCPPGRTEKRLSSMQGWRLGASGSYTRSFSLGFGRM